MPCRSRRQIFMVQKMIEAMEKDLREISLKKLSRAFLLHPFYISRIIKAVTGRSFKDLLRETRVKIVEELIRTTGLREHEIAAMVGLTPNYLSCFLKNTIGQRFGDLPPPPTSLPLSGPK